MPQHPSVDLAPFPPGFRWSAATAAFQVEGARTADGRGRSIWDDFVDAAGCRPRRRRRPTPAPTATDRHREDVALLAGLGVDRYRFSISWVRVQPEPGGTGAAGGTRLLPPAGR